MRQEGYWLLLILLSLRLVKVLCIREPFLIDAGPGINTAVESNDVSDPMSLVEDSPLGKNLNEIVDLIITLAQDILKKSGKATIKIPDVQEDFHKRFHFIKIKGTFKADNGWFKDLSTIHRTTDATLSHSGGNITVSVGLGLGTLQVGYDHYQVKVEHVSISGNIKGEVGSNSVFAKVNVMMQERGKCNLTLQQLTVSLGDIKVKVGGKSKPVDWILSKIATIVAKHMKGDAIKEAEQRLSEAAQKALDKYHC